MADHTIEAEPGSYSLTGHPVEMRVLRDFALDPGGPFYRFVLTYLAASAGMTPVYDAQHYPTFMDGVAGVFPGVVSSDARADLAECVRSVRGGALPQRQAEQLLCCMLANSTYESLPQGDHDRLKGDPVYEVFRHARHASSHGNRWHFFRSEPRARGVWRTVEIDDTRKGDSNPLQGKTCFYDTLQPADLLYLLRDVEALLSVKAA